MGSGPCGTSQTPSFHRGPDERKETPDAPIPVLHPPGDTKQTNLSMCLFWAAPYSAAAVRGRQGQQETEAAGARVDLSPESFSQPDSVPLSHLQEPLSLLQRSQYLPAALGLEVTEDLRA